VLPSPREEELFLRQMVAFAGQLRAAGVEVGTAELLDCLQALQHLSLARRDHFKGALGATLAKSARNREIFDLLFERFFDPLQAREQQTKRLEQQEKLIKQLEEAGEALQFKGEPLQLSDDEKIWYASLPEEGKAGLQRFLKATEEGKKVEASFRPLLETVVRGQLRYWRSRADAPAGEGGAGSKLGAPGLRHLDLKDIREADLPAVEELIARLARQVSSQLVRRQRRLSGAGAVDFRRTLRHNLQFGGCLFKIKYRRKQPRRQQLLFLGDVSASMSRYSTMILQFIYGLQTSVKNLELFVFSDNLEHLTPRLRQGGDPGQIVEQLVRRSKTWGGGTNIASALSTLAGEYASLLNMRTTIIVVSDTRTVTLARALEALDRVKTRVKRILWLNPLPFSEWSCYASVKAFAQRVEMWPCHTLAQLEKIVAGRLLQKNVSGKEVGNEQAYCPGR